MNTSQAMQRATYNRLSNEPDYYLYGSLNTNLCSVANSWQPFFLVGLADVCSLWSRRSGPYMARSHSNYTIAVWHGL